MTRKTYAVGMLVIMALVVGPAVVVASGAPATLPAYMYHREQLDETGIVYHFDNKRRF